MENQATGFGDMGGSVGSRAGPSKKRQKRTQTRQERNAHMLTRFRICGVTQACMCSRHENMLLNLVPQVDSCLDCLLLFNKATQECQHDNGLLRQFCGVERVRSPALGGVGLGH